MKYRYKFSTGFTLLEVIIAMTILSLILVLLFSTVFTANRTWASTERKISHNDDSRLIAHFIQKQISQNIPIVWADQKGQHLIFEGKDDQLIFTSTLPAHRGGGGIQLLTLRVNQKDETRSLGMSYQYADPDNFSTDENETTEYVTLLEDIERIELSYFGQERIDETPSWRDEWKNKEILPNLISLKIYAGADQQAWPEVKIPLHSAYIKGQPQFVLRKTNS